MNYQENSYIDILSVIQNIEECSSNDEVFTQLTAFTSSLGFSHVAIGALINPNHPHRVGLSNFPNEFTYKWRNNDYAIHDPIVRFALLTNAAFEWKSAKDHASRFGRKIYSELDSISLKNGICVPVKVGTFPKGMISLAHENPDLSTEELTFLELVCIHAYTKYLKVNNLYEMSKPVDLTKREIDVLNYVALGKSNWEAGKILSISEEGVKKHMKNISRKLNAANRAHAVTIALRTGQIFA